MRRGIRFLLLFFFFIAGEASAAISFQDGVFPELVTSGRALGLGNAFIAKVDDASSVFYNPAGLGTVRYGHLHISNLHIEVNKGWMDLSGGNAGSNFAKAFSIDGNRELLLENKGLLSYSRFQFMPNFTARYFSFGYLLSKKTRATIGTEEGDLFEFADRLDHGPYVAYNFSFFGGIFKLGASAAWLNRKEAFGERNPDITIDLGSDDYDKGRMMVITSGAKLTIPMWALPTFAVKVNNSSQKEFSKTGATAPDGIKQSIDVGFSLTPQLKKTMRFHWEVNYRDITKKVSGLTSARRLGVGLEVDFARSVFIRFGWGDGFGSFGLGVRTKALEFDLTSYAVDTTTSKFRGKEDRRFSMTISSGF